MGDDKIQKVKCGVLEHSVKQSDSELNNTEVDKAYYYSITSSAKAASPSRFEALRFCKGLSQ